MSWTNNSSGTPAGSGIFIKFQLGAVLTPSAGSITPTDTHHHVAAGTISAIATTNLDTATGVQTLLMVTADGTINFTTGASLVMQTTQITSGQSILFMLDGGTVWREIASIAANTQGMTQAANIVFAGPTSGGAAAPAFRALVAADVPSLAASKITSGQLALARGGSNADLSATGGANQVLQQASSGAAVTVGTLDAASIAAGTLANARGGVSASWTAVTYASGNFTTVGGGTWTVDSGDQTTYAYIMLGAKTMCVTFDLRTTSIATAPVQLAIAIPNSAVAAKATNAPYLLGDNSATRTLGVMSIAAAGTVINLLATTPGNAFTNSTNASSFQGQIVFEIQ